MSNLYKELHGCENRTQYLKMLSDQHGVDIDQITALADLLGPNEDFDGLVTSVEDLAMCGSVNNHFN